MGKAKQQLWSEMMSVHRAESGTESGKDTEATKTTQERVYEVMMMLVMEKEKHEKEQKENEEKQYTQQNNSDDHRQENKNANTNQQSLKLFQQSLRYELVAQYRTKQKLNLAGVTLWNLTWILLPALKKVLSLLLVSLQHLIESETGAFLLSFVSSSSNGMGNFGIANMSSVSSVLPTQSQNIGVTPDAIDSAQQQAANTIDSAKKHAFTLAKKLKQRIADAKTIESELTLKRALDHVVTTAGSVKDQLGQTVKDQLGNAIDSNKGQLGNVFLRGSLGIGDDSDTCSATSSLRGKLFRKTDSSALGNFFGNVRDQLKNTLGAISGTISGTVSNTGADALSKTATDAMSKTAADATILGEELLTGSVPESILKSSTAFTVLDPHPSAEILFSDVASTAVAGDNPTNSLPLQIAGQAVGTLSEAVGATVSAVGHTVLGTCRYVGGSVARFPPVSFTARCANRVFTTVDTAVGVPMRRVGAKAAIASGRAALASGRAAVTLSGKAATVTCVGCSYVAKPVTWPVQKLAPQKIALAGRIFRKAGALIPKIGHMAAVNVANFVTTHLKSVEKIITYFSSWLPAPFRCLEKITAYDARVVAEFWKLSQSGSDSERMSENLNEIRSNVRKIKKHCGEIAVGWKESGTYKDDPKKDSGNYINLLDSNELHPLTRSLNSLPEEKNLSEKKLLDFEPSSLQEYKLFTDEVRLRLDVYFRDFMGLKDFSTDQVLFTGLQHLHSRITLCTGIWGLEEEVEMEVDEEESVTKEGERSETAAQQKTKSFTEKLKENRMKRLFNKIRKFPLKQWLGCRELLMSADTENSNNSNSHDTNNFQQQERKKKVIAARKHILKKELSTISAFILEQMSQTAALQIALWKRTQEWKRGQELWKKTSFEMLKHKNENKNETQQNDIPLSALASYEPRPAFLFDPTSHVEERWTLQEKIGGSSKTCSKTEKRGSKTANTEKILKKRTEILRREVRVCPRSEKIRHLRETLKNNPPGKVHTAMAADDIKGSMYLDEECSPSCEKPASDERPVVKIVSKKQGEGAQYGGTNLSVEMSHFDHGGQDASGRQVGRNHIRSWRPLDYGDIATVLSRKDLQFEISV